ncbi:MAG: response regulator transcription factor [Propionibacteriales bacterium]|nr:response regulator transcription factor [Propionibacteriales bacterium]
MADRRDANMLHAGSVASMQEAVDLTDPDAPDRARLIALDGLATVQMLEGAYADAERTAAEALSIDGPARHDQHRHSAINTYAIALISHGREEEGLALMREARSPDQHQIDLRYFINHSNELDVTGDFSGAVAVATEGMERARAAGREWGFATMLIGNAVWPLIHLGRVAEAEQLLGRPRPIGSISGSHQMHLQMLESFLPAWHGQVDEAIRKLSLLEALMHSPQRQYRMQYAHAMTLLHLWAGRPEAVPELVAPIWAERERHKGPHLWELAHLTAWAHRESGAATPVSKRVLRDIPPTRVARSWQLLIDAETADDLPGWEAAKALTPQLGIPAWISPHVEVQIVRKLLVSGERQAAAADRLGEALERAGDLGLVPLIGRLEGLRSRAGLAPRAGSPPALLTPRESEVMALVAEGRTNREVAEALFISSKTASVHLTNIMAKLNVRSRGRAAAVARERGLI